jgi:uncharacterized protein DUF6600
MSTMLSREIPTSTGLVSRPARRVRWVAHVAALAGALLSTACTFGAGAVAHAETGGASPPGYTADAEAQVDPAADGYADTDPSALTDFREPLSPYGSWVEDSSYGTVWVPNSTVVGSDFAPYQSAGHWALDDNEDWIWVSDYDWGYIPFHYGRWVWLANSGWGWIPGRTYAPAWVNWRVGEGGYIGWAPMPPSWYWYGGVATGLWVQPYAAYCFVPTAYVFHEHVHTYVVRDRAVVSAAAATTRPYTPAHPTVGGSGGHSAGARSSGGFRTASPRLGDAGISAANAPRSRVAPDSRAAAFATHSGSASIRHSAFGAPLPSSHRGVAADAWQTHGSSFDRGQSRTLDRGQPAFDRSQPVRDRGQPAFDRSQPALDRSQPALDRSQRAPAFDRAAPQGRDRSASPVLRTPTRDVPRAAPSFSPAPASRPSFTGSPAVRPSAPAARPSAPSAPAFRPSAPSRPSTPSFHAPSAPSHSGGGRHR